VPESWDEECRKAEAVELQGDFQNYAQQDYEDDMKMALVAGISAFAMNVGHDTTDSGQYRAQRHNHKLELTVPSTTDQMTKAFAAAEAVGFSLFFSFDMVSWRHDEGRERC